MMWTGAWRRPLDYGDVGGRGARRPRDARRDRRLDARQDRRRGPRCRRAARPALPEPLLRPRGRADPLRRPDDRRRPDHGRRHGRAARATISSTSRRPRPARTASASGSSGGTRSGATTPRSSTSPARSRRSTSPGRGRARRSRALTDGRRLERGARATSTRGELAVAGVPCLALRIGFVGELGYELHCPASAGEHLWDALVAAGAVPFGLEPQRVLRLEKAHVIVGQDTDSESNLLSAGMPWILKLDKDDFVGRCAAELVQERGVRERLVGFTLPAGVAAARGRAGRRRRPPGRARHERPRERAARPDDRPRLGRARAAPTRAPRSRSGSTARGTSARPSRSAPFYDPDGREAAGVSRLEFLSPVDAASRAWRSSRRSGTRSAPASTDVSHLGKLELRGAARRASSRRRARSCCGSGPGRGLLVVDGSPAAALARLDGRRRPRLRHDRGARRLRVRRARTLLRRLTELDLARAARPSARSRAARRR